MPRRTLITLLAWLATLVCSGVPAIGAEQPLPWLHADGVNLVDPDGHKVVLRGFNAGGGFVMETWQSALDLDRAGTPYSEIKDNKSFWGVIAERFGPERTLRLQRIWQDAWFNERDVQKLADLGCNAVRIPFLEDGYKGASAFPDKPRERGWDNVCYSVHHYRMDARSPAKHEQAIEKEFPELRQQQLAWGVPLFIGEFSVITREAGGAAMMQSYFDLFNRYGWSWTAWNYKKVSDRDGRENIWGLVTNSKPWDRPDPYKDSFDELSRKFARYDTSNLVVQEDYAKAVREATGK